MHEHNFHTALKKFYPRYKLEVNRLLKISVGQKGEFMRYYSLIDKKGDTQSLDWPNA